MLRWIFHEDDVKIERYLLKSECIEKCDRMVEKTEKRMITNGLRLVARKRQGKGLNFTVVGEGIGCEKWKFAMISNSI